MTAYLLPNGKQQFIDINGKPLVSGNVYMYSPNTLIAKDTWSDPEQNALNSIPIVLDSRGQASIYGNGAYRQIVKDSLGNTIWDEEIENVETGLTPSGGLLITGTVGSNSYVVRTDAQIGLWSNNKTLICRAMTDPTGEMSTTNYAPDSLGASAQLQSSSVGFVAGNNTSGSWVSWWATHQPSGNGNDIVPIFTQSNGAVVCGAGNTASAPWNTLATANWFDVRSSGGTLCRSGMVAGAGHAFSLKASYMLEVNGNAQVGDVDGSGVTDHALQMGWSSGGSVIFLQAFRNSTSTFLPLSLGASQTGLTIANGLVNAANDAAAAAAGVPVTGLYRNGSVVMIRVT